MFRSSRFGLVNALTAVACTSYESFVVASICNGFLTGGLMTIVIVHVQEIFGRGDYGHVLSYIMFCLGEHGRSFRLVFTSDQRYQGLSVNDAVFC